MRVCHVTSVHPANDVRILYKECASLSKRYEVFLVAPNVDNHDEEGVHVVGVELPHNRSARQLFLGRVYAKALSINADVYHLHDPELISLGLKIKRHFANKKRVRVVFDSHEDVPMQLLTKEYIPAWCRKPLSKIYAISEKKRLKQYDALVTVTPTIQERLEKINACCKMVTNYPIYTEAETPSRPTGSSHTPCIGFAGGVVERYMHDNIIESLRHTQARYLMAGRVFSNAYFAKLQSSDMWSRVEYVGVLPPQEVNQFYSKVDIGMVLQDYAPDVGYHRGTIGVTKLFEFMMAGIPVVATDFDLWKQIVEGEACGLCVNPHNVQAIADAINYLTEHPDQAAKMGENGRKAVRKTYNWATQEQELFDLYDMLQKQ